LDTSLQLQTSLASDLETIEGPVMCFFDKHAEYYETSWDLREHGLNVGIFDGDVERIAEQDLETGYEHCRDHVIELLQKIHTLDRDARILDVCCGTGATLSRIVNRYACKGVGVDISKAQIARANQLREQGVKEGRLLFRQGSASLIDQVVGEQPPFTHVLSQDGLLFAHDKPRAVEGIFDLLEAGGAFVLSDFVPQISKQEIDAALRARVYEDVKWGQGFTFREYFELLTDTGFEIIQAELRPLDMRNTYEKLIPRTHAMAAGGDATYTFLARRYEGIVKAISNGALSWAWFAVRKP
jgi:SAM-dependent methyltransferase